MNLALCGDPHLRVVTVGSNPKGLVFFESGFPNANGPFTLFFF